MAPSFLFVCLGNICRSPLAEGIAKRIAQKEGLDILIDSAGTGDWHLGEAPCADSIKVAKMNGLDISMLRARQVTPDDFQKFTYIIALDDNNLNDLRAMGGSPLKLGDFGAEGKDVPDPYFFKEFEGFHHVYAMIEKCVTQALKTLA